MSISNNRGGPRKTDKLELSIVSTVRKLDIGASAALRASHSLLRNYRSMLSTIERNLNYISRSKTGGSPFSSDISSLAISISAHSRALSGYVKTMQERLRAPVRDIEKTQESADKRALKRKIWKWIARVFKALATLISAGGAIFALIHPVGLVESVAIGAASMLTGAIARLCTLVQDSKYLQVASMLPLTPSFSPSKLHSLLSSEASRLTCYSLSSQDTTKPHSTKSSPFCETTFPNPPRRQRLR